jgi:hypothetical protein
MQNLEARRQKAEQSSIREVIRTSQDEGKQKENFSELFWNVTLCLRLFWLHKNEFT